MSDEFEKEIELPKAEAWTPTEGEERVFMIKRMFIGQFGVSTLVIDTKPPYKEVFLPKHIFLYRLLEVAGLKEGHTFKIQCIKVGSRKVGDTYEYRLWVAKEATPF